MFFSINHVTMWKHHLWMISLSNHHPHHPLKPQLLHHVSRTFLTGPMTPKAPVRLHAEPKRQWWRNMVWGWSHQGSGSKRFHRNVNIIIHNMFFLQFMTLQSCLIIKFHGFQDCFSEHEQQTAHRGIVKSETSLKVYGRHWTTTLPVALASWTFRVTQNKLHLSSLSG